jgi:hypothetical protein
MANTLIYARDSKTGLTYPLKLIDNGDDTYSLSENSGVGDASQVTLLAVKTVTDAIPDAGAMTSIIARQDAVDSTAQKRQAGKTQTFSKAITSAANAGDVTLATATTQGCNISSITVRSNGATTSDLTSIAVFGGASKVVTFISALSGVRANIVAADQQVAWTGKVSLAATKTIVMTLTGTGATAVNLTVDFEYEAQTDGGYLA